MIARSVCKAASWEEEVKKFRKEWLPAFRDPLPSDAGHTVANPCGRWGYLQSSSTLKYVECRAHTNCQRQIKGIKSEQGGLDVFIRGVHTQQVT